MSKPSNEVHSATGKVVCNDKVLNNPGWKLVELESTGDPYVELKIYGKSYGEYEDVGKTILSVEEWDKIYPLISGLYLLTEDEFNLDELNFSYIAADGNTISLEDIDDFVNWPDNEIITNISAHYFNKDGVEFNIEFTGNTVQ